MLQVRLIAHALTQSRIATDPSSAPRVGPVIGHHRDALGRNWSILDLERGDGLEIPFREIVDRLRLEYDLG